MQMLSLCCRTAWVGALNIHITWRKHSYIHLSFKIPWKGETSFPVTKTPHCNLSGRRKAGAPASISASSTRWQHGRWVRPATPPRSSYLPPGPSCSLLGSHPLAPSSVLAWLFSTTNLQFVSNGSCLSMNTHDLIIPDLEAFMYTAFCQSWLLTLPLEVYPKLTSSTKPSPGNLAWSQLHTHHDVQSQRHTSF